MKEFFARFKADPENEKQLRIIDQVKQSQGISNDEDFIMHLIQLGEKFVIVDQVINVDFQIELDADLRKEYQPCIAEIKNTVSDLTQIEERCIVPKRYDSNIDMNLDQESDSEESLEAKSPDKFSPMKQNTLTYLLEQKQLNANTNLQAPPVKRQTMAEQSQPILPPPDKPKEEIKTKAQNLFKMLTKKN